MKLHRLPTLTLLMVATLVASIGTRPVQDDPQEDPALPPILEQEPDTLDGYLS